MIRIASIMATTGRRLSIHHIPDFRFRRLKIRFDISKLSFPRPEPRIIPLDFGKSGFGQFSICLFKLASTQSELERAKLLPESGNYYLTLAPRQEYFYEAQQRWSLISVDNWKKRSASKPFGKRHKKKNILIREVFHRRTDENRTIRAFSSPKCWSPTKGWVLRNKNRTLSFWINFDPVKDSRIHTPAKR